MPGIRVPRTAAAAAVLACALAGCGATVSTGGAPAQRSSGAGTPSVAGTATPTNPTTAATPRSTTPAAPATIAADPGAYQTCTRFRTTGAAVIRELFRGHPAGAAALRAYATTLSVLDGYLSSKTLAAHDPVRLAVTALRDTFANERTEYARTSKADTAYVAAWNRLNTICEPVLQRGG
jgi:hypothetical protein